MRLLGFGLIVVRLGMSLALCLQGHVVGLVLGLSGLQVVGSTLLAWLSGKPDLTWRGLCVGLGYFSVLLIQPPEHQKAWAGLILWQLFFVQVWIRLLLGRCCTVSGPVFVRVVTRFPYSLVRHPLTVVELLIAAVCVGQAPTLRNLVVGVLLLVVKATLTIWEENFLLNEQSYQAYARRVAWRWVPGIW